MLPANTQRFLNIAGKFRWAYLGQTLQQDDTSSQLREIIVRTSGP